MSLLCAVESLKVCLQTFLYGTHHYVNFIDFGKAFDSVQHTKLWNILRSYGFPDKIVNILIGKLILPPTSVVFAIWANRVSGSKLNLE